MLSTILTDLPGVILPFSIILTPLRAVQEKSPRSGFTGYVYHNLPINKPFFVFFIMSLFAKSPGATLRLWGNAIGMGMACLPIGEPGLAAFPLELVPFLNASKASENRPERIPDFMRSCGDVEIPSSSNGLLPMPSGLCGSSVRVKLSFEMLLPSLSEKQLRFSVYVFRLKFEAKTNANNSPNA